MNNPEDQEWYTNEQNAGVLLLKSSSASLTQNEHPVFTQKQEKVVISAGGRIQPLPKDFMPDPVYVEFLETYHKIPSDFTLSQLVDFRLYWLETGEFRKAWQNKFKNHVIYQWKRVQSETAQRTNRSTAKKITDTSWAETI